MSNSGGMKVDSGPTRALTNWDWDANHLHVQFTASTGVLPYGFDLYYTSPTGGSCDCYLDTGDDWYFLGSGTFTDQDLNP